MPGEQGPDNSISYYVNRLAASFHTRTKLGSAAVSAEIPPKNTGDFIEPIDEWTKQELNNLPLELATLVLQGNISSKRVATLLRRNTALRTTYAETTIPETFRQAHPNILFMPPPTTKPPARSTIAYLDKSGLLNDPAFHETLTTPEALLEQLFHVRHNVLIGVDERLVLGALSELAFSYISNLELYRLVKDPTGAIKRETRTPDLDSPGSIATPGQAPTGELAWRRGLHPALHHLPVDHWTTWWYRYDAPTMPSVRPLAQSTVGELEKTNKITLDLLMPRSSALVAFRGPTA
jgi:hypothetical protein